MGRALKKQRQQTPLAKNSIELATANLPTLALARLTSLDEGNPIIQLGGATVSATIDEALSPIVLEGALERREPVVIELRGDVVCVVGLLRTQPTPGVDESDEFAIKAKKVSIEGDEVQLRSGLARMVFRAAGEVETMADRIVTRAEGVHKLVGRMLRLN